MREPIRTGMRKRAGGGSKKVAFLGFIWSSREKEERGKKKEEKH